MEEPESGFWARGKLVLLWKDYARGQFPPDQWEGFLAGLPQDSPWVLPPDPQGWIPYSRLWEALEALGRARAWDTYGPRGIAAAQMMFREGFLDTPVPHTPEGYLERLPDVWDEMYRGGSLILETLLQGHARIRIAFPHPAPALYMIMFSAWIRECMALFGARGTEVSLAPEPDGGRIIVNWFQPPSR